MTIQLNSNTKIETNRILDKKVKDNDLSKAITKTWNSGLGGSCTMIIPRKISKRHGLDKPSYIVIEERNEGIMIKKIDV
jgi:hypothetical protein